MRILVERFLDFFLGASGTWPSATWERRGVSGPAVCVAAAAADVAEGVVCDEARALRRRMGRARAGVRGGAATRRRGNGRSASVRYIDAIATGNGGVIANQFLSSPREMLRTGAELEKSGAMLRSPPGRKDSAPEKGRFPLRARAATHELLGIWKSRAPPSKTQRRWQNRADSRHVLFHQPPLIVLP